MNIRDWSSDVCSSDLLLQTLKNNSVLKMAAAQQPEVPTRLYKHQIGRASCRERVFPVV